MVLTVPVYVRSVATLVALAVSLSIGAGVAYADPVSCQRAIVKDAAKFSKKTMRLLQTCEDKILRGTHAGPCPDPKTAEKIAKAESKLAGGLDKKCGGADRQCGVGSDEALGDIGWDGGSCPNFEGGSCTNAIAHCGDVATCLGCIDEAAVEQAVGLYYDAYTPTGSAMMLRCQRILGRASGVLFRKAGVALRKCQDSVLKGKTAGPCPDARAEVKIASAKAKMVQQACKVCGGADATCGTGGDDFSPSEIGFAASCPDVTVPGGEACGGPIDDLEDLVTCVECVTRFKALCAGLLSAPGLAAAPDACTGAGATPVPTATLTPTPVPTESPTPEPTPTDGAGIEDITDLIGPNGDADGDGWTNEEELANCSNPADPASTPENDDTLCNNNTIFSDILGDAWGNTNTLAEPSYDAAVGALVAQNAAECSAYCASTPNINQPQSCEGVWPWSGVPEHGAYTAGETVEATYLDEDGWQLHSTIFLPPGVTCVPDDEPVCDGVTDAVTCTAPGNATYPAVIITEGFTGTQRMYFWAAHRLAAQGYIAMTFDVSGQGRSQGPFPNGDSGVASDTGEGGFSRDTGTTLNWFVSASNPVLNLVEQSPLLIVNQGTGASDHLETYNLGTAGHSAGASGGIAYQQSTEAAYPVRTRAVVAWSHFDAVGTIGNVPIQLHSGDEDSGFIQPPGSGNQGPTMERRYDRLAGDRDLDGNADFTPHDRQIIMIEDGTHLNYSQVPWAYYPTWGEEVQYHYTLAWFDLYLRGDVSRTMSDVSGNVIQSVDQFNDYAECVGGSDCFTATERLQMSHLHLSDTWCSRYDIGGATSADMKGGGCQTQ